MTTKNETQKPLFDQSIIYSGCCFDGKEDEKWTHKWVQKDLGMSNGPTWKGNAVCEYCGEQGTVVDTPNRKLVVIEKIEVE